MRRSVDGGGTWEPTRFLVSEPSSVKDGLNLGASTFDPDTGTVFLHYGTCGHACRPNGSSWVLSSTDHGVTFGSPASLTDAVVAAGWSMINPGPGTGVHLPATVTQPARLAVAVWGRRLGSSAVEGGVAALLRFVRRGRDQIAYVGCMWQSAECGLCYTRRSQMSDVLYSQKQPVASPTQPLPSHHSPLPSTTTNHS